MTKIQKIILLVSISLVFLLPMKGCSIPPTVAPEIACNQPEIIDCVAILE